MKPVNTFYLIFLILLMSCRTSQYIPIDSIIWMRELRHSEAEVSSAQPYGQSVMVS